MRIGLESLVDSCKPGGIDQQLPVILLAEICGMRTLPQTCVFANEVATGLPCHKKKAHLEASRYWSTNNALTISNFSAHQFFSIRKRPISSPGNE